jgi:hypothetical protein
MLAVVNPATLPKESTMTEPRPEDATTKDAPAEDEAANPRVIPDTLEDLDTPDSDADVLEGGCQACTFQMSPCGLSRATT